MKIIGFAGKAGSGKDTAGYLLQHALEARGYKVAVLSFADKLKDAAALLLGWNRELLQDDVEYKEGRTLPDGSIDPACDLLNLPSRRDFLQRFGTEAMRNNIHQDFWIRVLQLAIINGEYSDYDFGIVTDMRFINEIEFVRNNGGMAVRIDRVGEMSTLTAHVDHASENAWKVYQDWDVHILNVVNDSMDKDVNKDRLRDILIQDIVMPITSEERYATATG